MSAIDHFSSGFLSLMNGSNPISKARGIHPTSMYIPSIPMSFIVRCQGRVMYFFIILFS
ncbi:MAG: hypothetical protein ACD_51C00228G0001 [uncultured bacterium]|nr:MAG: hypothetical protein ACD_51C00228G0001 [uncultured bacterium]